MTARFTINRSQQMMLLVLACLTPGLSASIWFYGIGIVTNLLIVTGVVFAAEVFVLYIRKRPFTSAWDGSGFVTAALLALSLPPGIDWGILVFGALFAIIVGKQLYGGLGQNPFNPAMVGYCAMIISFPLAMSTWPPLLDGLSGATVLDTFKWREGRTIDEIWSTQNGFGHLAGIASEWINLAYLVGGMVLVWLKAARWEAALSMLATLAVFSILFYDSGSSTSLGSPLFHLFTGGTMLAAFFILTDPVTTPDTTRGLVLFGIGVGALTFLIRSIGAYPDGIGFAVLLMNALVPLYEQLRLKS